MPKLTDPAALADIARFFNRLQWALLLVGVGLLLYVLGPVLTPFVAAVLLAWLGDPVVDRLQARGMSRDRGVRLVFGTMLTVFIVLLVVVIPLLERQVVQLVSMAPTYYDWIVERALPWVRARTGFDVVPWLDADRLIGLVREHWQGAGGVASEVIGFLSRSGFTVLGWVANLVLIPFLTYFFLRDWDLMVERVGALVPRDRIDTVTRLARESDAVLGSFLRGQFLVMIGMGIFYAVGLGLVGLDLGVLIGIIAGVLTFIPYIGPLTVIVAGSIAALVQFGDWPHLIGVAAVWGIGQLLESYVLTPKLVGDRIGLGPVTVVFAVMAGGTLFGFLGMLLALPVAAVANVLLRHAVEQYRQSRLYTGGSPQIVLTDAAPPRGDGDGA